MICPKCNQEVSNDSIFCNKCGNSLEHVAINNEYHEDEIQTEISNVIEKEDDGEETESESAKLKEHRYKKIVIAIVLVAVSLFGLIYYNNYNKTQEATKYKEEYEINFTIGTIDILTETYASQLMCSTISSVWRDSIDSRYKDFNTEITRLQEDWKAKGVLKNRETAKAEIEKKMKQLQNPPEDYKEAYKLIVELYGYYSQIYNQAVSPGGSLLTYNQDVNQKSSDFDKTYEKIKVIKPDIEIKAKEK